MGTRVHYREATKRKAMEMKQMLLNYIHYYKEIGTQAK
jgi:hypothetical protein